MDKGQAGSGGSRTRGGGLRWAGEQRRSAPTTEKELKRTDGVHPRSIARVNNYHMNILNLIATCTSHKLAETSTCITKQLT
jgi:hypothetical protein